MQARRLLAVLGTKDQEKTQPFRQAMTLVCTNDGKAGDIHYESASGHLASAWTPCRGAAKYHTIPRNRGTESHVNDISAQTSIELLAGDITARQVHQIRRKAQRAWQGLQRRLDCMMSSGNCSCSQASLRKQFRRFTSREGIRRNMRSSGETSHLLQFGKR